VHWRQARLVFAAAWSHWQVGPVSHNRFLAGTEGLLPAAIESGFQVFRPGRDLIKQGNKMK
jgi:hypothetical protein